MDGHQAVGGIHFLIAALGQLRLILQALQPHAPLLIDGLAAPLQFLHRAEGDLDLVWLEDLQDALTDGPVNRVSREPNAGRGIISVLLAAGAFVNRVDAAIAGIARRQASATMPAQEHPLQQGPTFPRGPAGTLLGLIGLVLCEHLLVFQILIPADIAGMMLLDQHLPGANRLLLDFGLNLAVGRYGFEAAIAPENVSPGIAGIAQ